MRCYRVEPAAVVLTVRLTPRAARDSIDGVGTLSDGREVVLARVRAVPDKGEANRALVELLAKDAAGAEIGGRGDRGCDGAAEAGAHRGRAAGARRRDRGLATSGRKLAPRGVTRVR